MINQLFRGKQIYRKAICILFSFFVHENMKHNPKIKVGYLKGEMKTFFSTSLAAQKAHFRQKSKFYKLSETPL